METITKLYRTYSTIKFWMVSSLISIGSALLIPVILPNLISSTDAGETLGLGLCLLIAVFGVGLLPFAIWQHAARKSFFKWLRENWQALDSGVTHPSGYTVTLDTPLITYKAVFSAFVLTVSFESKPYVYQHRSAGSAEFVFTLLTAIFGWWFLGLNGIVETIKAISFNLRTSSTFTLRQLINTSEK